MHSRQVCLGRPHRTRPRLEHRRRREVRAPIRQNTHHVVSLIGIKKTIVVRASQCQDDAFRRRYAAPVTLVSSVDNLSSLRYARLVIGMWSSTWLCPRNMHDRVKGATANVPAGKKRPEHRLCLVISHPYVILSDTSAHLRRLPITHRIYNDADA